MISLLKVRNLALVEEADVEFGPGLNIVSGETGAGKSVLIGALYLLLGERADTGAVRAGAAQCSVEAVFSLEPDALAAVDAALAEAGMAPCEDGTLIVRRTVRAAGGGQIHVNDAPATAGLLRRIGASLVDLHGPHDHQLLFHPAEQLAILDAYAHDGAERAAYAAAWDRRAALLDRKAALEAAGGPDAAAQADLLASRIKEIEDAALEEGEEEAVRAEQQTAGNAQRILELGQLATQTLSEGEDSILQRLAPVRKALDQLSRLAPATAADWPATLRPLADGLAALSVAIQRDLSSIEADPARLEWLDRRLWEYERIKRRYGPELSDVRRVLADAKTRLDEIENRGARLEELALELVAAEADLRLAGTALRARRAAAAADLAPAILGELRAIGFENAAFDIPLDEAPEPQSDGLDTTDFGFAPNRGEPMRPLRAIASSGEISRVMLAVKAILAGADRVGTLVFDEIDANIGGETAPAVGRKLAQVAKGRQVIAITHLPAVAACGTTQYAVNKDVGEDGRTRTHVRRLSREERVEELARMLGGRDSTSVALRHARELLKNASAAADGI